MEDYIYFCCGCNEWKFEDDFETKQTYAQTMESPAEYEDFCKECGIHIDSCPQYDLSEIVELLNKKGVKL